MTTNNKKLFTVTYKVITRNEVVIAADSYAQMSDILQKLSNEELVKNSSDTKVVVLDYSIADKGDAINSAEDVL